MTTILHRKMHRKVLVIFQQVKVCMSDGDVGVKCNEHEHCWNDLIQCFTLKFVCVVTLSTISCRLSDVSF